MGSVSIVRPFFLSAPFQKRLPARLGDAGDFSAKRQVAETDTAHIELADIAARTAAAAAAIAHTNFELQLFPHLGELCSATHLLS
jgi:hypothetical protein